MKGKRRMQMLIVLACCGIEAAHRSLKKCAVIAKLYFRGDSLAENEKVLTVKDLHYVKPKSDGCLLGQVTTKWFDLDPVKENWLFNLHRLDGIKTEIKISGRQLVATGTTDIEINAWGKYGRVHQLLNRKDVQTDGTSFTEFNVQGVLRPNEAACPEPGRIVEP
jgi:hypothetical protein